MGVARNDSFLDFCIIISQFSAISKPRALISETMVFCGLWKVYQKCADLAAQHPSRFEWTSAPVIFYAGGAADGS